MRDRDWLFAYENRIHNFRSTGVLLNNGKVLIQRGINDTEFALPGGHVIWGETSAETLVREYKEELGADISVDRLIWVEEVFWKWGAREAHTICHYHLVRLTNSHQIPDYGSFKSLSSDESKLIFQWVNINGLQDYKIYPAFLKDKINNLSEGIEHFITRE
ncbi:MAG: NUDIX domain-containing protein [Firmicutes bacterium]|nr:NUDIX domain-containing protein [Bacillota bacterium]